MVLNLKENRNRLAVVGFLLLLLVLMGVSYGAAAQPCAPDGADLSARLGFLADFGHYCDGESENSKAVVIPLQWSDVYESYNALQVLQGFDLSHYKGQTATLYTYAVTNYSEKDAVYAHLLVSQGVIIGGDIASARLDGFMEGFGGERVA